MNDKRNTVIGWGDGQNQSLPRAALNHAARRLVTRAARHPLDGVLRRLHTVEAMARELARTTVRTRTDG